MPAPMGKALACGIGVAGPALMERVFSLLLAEWRPKLAADKMRKAARLFALVKRAATAAWSAPGTIRMGWSGARTEGSDLRCRRRTRAARRARPHAISRHHHLSPRRHPHQGRSRQYGGCARSACADPRSSHRGVFLAAARSLQDAGGKGKWLLRQVLYRHVPKALVERPKSGFAIPLGQWLRGPLRAWAEELLSEKRPRRGGLLNPAPIQARWAEHLEGTRNWRPPLASADVPGLASPTRDLRLARPAPARADFAEGRPRCRCHSASGFSARCVAAGQ